MIRLILPRRRRPNQPVVAKTSRMNLFRRVAILCACALISFAASLPAQITVDTRTGAVTNNSTGSTVSTVDRRYQQITPTHVPLSKTELDPKTRIELIRLIQAEQGFAMRPFPRGHKGLILAANGKLEPAGEAYVSMVTSEGLSARPGDRLVITDVKIDHTKIVFDLNGGPDPRHRFLRHIIYFLKRRSNALRASSGRLTPAEVVSRSTRTRIAKKVHWLAASLRAMRSGMGCWHS